MVSLRPTLQAARARRSLFTTAPAALAGCTRLLSPPHRTTVFAMRSLGVLVFQRVYFLWSAPAPPHWASLWCTCSVSAVGMNLYGDSMILAECIFSQRAPGSVCSAYFRKLAHFSRTCGMQIFANTRRVIVQTPNANECPCKQSKFLSIRKNSQSDRAVADRSRGCSKDRCSLCPMARASCCPARDARKGVRPVVRARPQCIFSQSPHLRAAWHIFAWPANFRKFAPKCRIFSHTTPVGMNSISPHTALHSCGFSKLTPGFQVSK